MPTGTPFAPTPFNTSVVAPQTASLFRRAPYISTSEYRFSPNAVDTKNLVRNSTNTEVDSLASLAQVILRASGWVDQICFHRADGTLAASPTTEKQRIVPKPDGSIEVICNFKPVLEVTGLAFGPSMSQLANLDSTSAGTIEIDGKILRLPQWGWSNLNQVVTPRPVDTSGHLLVVWTYINGFGHTYLTANASLGASSITVASSIPGGSTVSGVYAGTQLAIHDGNATELVTVQSTPTGTTLALASPLQFAHTVPSAPDTLRVSALPWAPEQATISLVNVLVKVQASRAMQMPSIGGGPPTRTVIAQAGAMDDYERAVELLADYTVTYLHS